MYRSYNNEDIEIAGVWRLTRCTRTTGDVAQSFRRSCLNERWRYDTSRASRHNTDKTTL